MISANNKKVDRELRKLGNSLAGVYIRPSSTGQSVYVYFVLNKEDESSIKTIDDIIQLLVTDHKAHGFIFHTRVLNGRKVKDVVPSDTVKVV